MQGRSNAPWVLEQNYRKLEKKFLSLHYPLEEFALWHPVVLREFLWVADYARIAEVLETPRFKMFYEQCRAIAISSQYARLPVELQISALPKTQKQNFTQVLKLLKGDGENEEEN